MASQTAALSQKLFRCGICHADFTSLAACVGHMKSGSACCAKNSTSSSPGVSVDQDLSMSSASSVITATATGDVTQAASVNTSIDEHCAKLGVSAGSEVRSRNSQESVANLSGAVPSHEAVPSASLSSQHGDLVTTNAAVAAGCVSVLAGGKGGETNCGLASQGQTTGACSSTEQVKRVSSLENTKDAADSADTSSSPENVTQGKQDKSWSGAKQFACSECPARFRHQSSLSTHRRRHLGKNPFSCDMCQKEFWDPSNLRVHMRTHTDHRPFACDICGHRSNQLQDIKNHRRIHTGEMPFTCPVEGCGRKFRDPSHMRRHKKTHLGTQPTVKCDLCDAKFYHASTLSRHRRCHTGEKNFICSLCKARFARLDTLRLHQRTHTGERPYKCATCSMTFADRSQCRRHMKKEEHGDVILSDLPPKLYRPRTIIKNEPIELDPEPNSEAKAASKLAPKKPTVIQVPLAITKANGTADGETTYETIEIELPDTGVGEGADGDEITYQYGEMLITISRAAVSQLKGVNREEGNTGVVKKETDMEKIGHHSPVDTEDSELSGRATHSSGLPTTGDVATMTGEDTENAAVQVDEKVEETSSEPSANRKMRVPCRQCGQKFNNFASFQKHLRYCQKMSAAKTQAAQEEQPQTADNVQTSSEQNSSSDHGYPVSPARTTVVGLRRQRTARQGDKRFFCSDCDMSFFHRAELKRHSLVHSGELPYECGYCGKRVRDPSNFQRHVRTHTGERPYQCSVCKKRFAQAGHLTAHLRTHTGERPFACNQCGARFVESNHLRHHLKTHTQMRPYKCDVCSFSFLRKAELRRHHLIHFGSKDIQCPDCPATFFRHDALNHHLKKHRPELRVQQQRYSCPHCHQPFRKPGFLYRHINVAHRAANKANGSKPDSENSVVADALCELATGRRVVSTNKDGEGEVQTVQIMPIDTSEEIVPEGQIRTVKVVDADASEEVVELSIPFEVMEVSSGHGVMEVGSGHEETVQLIEATTVDSPSHVEEKSASIVTSDHDANVIQVKDSSQGQMLSVESLPPGSVVVENAMMADGTHYIVFSAPEPSTSVQQTIVGSGSPQTGPTLAQQSLSQSQQTCAQFQPEPPIPQTVSILNCAQTEVSDSDLLAGNSAEVPVATTEISADIELSTVSSPRVSQSQQVATTLQNLQLSETATSTSVSSQSAQVLQDGEETVKLLKTSQSTVSSHSSVVPQTSIGSARLVDNSSLELTMQTLLSGQAQLESVSAVEVSSAAGNVNSSGQSVGVMIKQEPSHAAESSPVVTPLRTRSGRERKIKVKFSM